MLLCCCFLRCFIFCVIGNLPIIGAASGSCCACLIACLSSKKDFQRMLFKRCTNKMMESFAFFTVRGLSVCWLLLTSVFAGADMLCFWSQSLSSRAKKKKKNGRGGATVELTPAETTSPYQPYMGKVANSFRLCCQEQNCKDTFSLYTCSITSHWKFVVVVCLWIHFSCVEECIWSSGHAGLIVNTNNHESCMCVNDIAGMLNTDHFSLH